MPEQKQFSIVVYRSRKMSYINRNESAFKCFESMRNTQEKDEDYVLHIFGRNEGGFLSSPLFLFVARNAYWSR